MKSLLGKVTANGTIEFSYSRNEWAYQTYEKLVAAKRETGRIELNPQKVPLEIHADGLSDSDSQWVNRIRMLIDNSDTVFLRALDKSFRFQKAIRKITPVRELVTLGGQQDIDAYAKKHWAHIKYFYANRTGGFNFDIKKFVTKRREASSVTRPMDLLTRVATQPEGDVGQLQFAATGSGASNEIITWRSTIDEGTSGSFNNNEVHVRVKVQHAKLPLTFLHEFREEFNNDSYEFEGDNLLREVTKITREVRDKQAEA